MADLVLDPTTSVELAPPPDTSHLITEDDTPVDNLFSEKQQRLLTEPLYSSWRGPGDNRPFVAAANVGVFYHIDAPAIVPDAFLSLDVVMPEDWWKTEGRSYLIWAVGKPPDVVIEIVSNTKGGELTRKMQLYAQMRVAYYAVYDPDTQIQGTPLVIYQLQGMDYVQTNEPWFHHIDLGLALWEGEYEERSTRWLRWIDDDGNLIPTGRDRANEEQTRADAERTRADEERARADAERTRADEERTRADEERARAERLAAQLRAAGIEPE